MTEREITFEIVEHLGVINKNDSGWTKELNIVSWNAQTPKYDIRDWDPDHERMGRGITLMDREMRRTVELYMTANNRKVLREAREEQAARKERRRAAAGKEAAAADTEAAAADAEPAKGRAGSKYLSADVDPGDAPPAEL